MNVITGHGELAKDLLNAFGLQDENVISIQFSIASNAAAVVTIQRFILRNEWDEVVSAFKKYNLVSKEDGVKA